MKTKIFILSDCPYSLEWSYFSRAPTKRASAMQTESDYRMRAEECVQLAQNVRIPEQRTMLLHIAETWLRLADDAQRAGTGNRSAS
jgi:hypothetical protein